MELGASGLHLDLGVEAAHGALVGIKAPPDDGEGCIVVDLTQVEKFW